MKKIIFVIGFIIFSLSSYSQSGYGGLIIDKSVNSFGVRTFINAVLMEKDFIGNSTYTSVFGLGLNSLGNTSFSLGFDVHQPILNKSNIGLIYGGSIELFGMQKVNHSFLPNFRVGIENKKCILFMTNNYIFKPFTYQGEKGYDPNLRPTIGLFYKINR